MLLPFQSLRAQAQTLQFLPEVDAYLKLSSEIQGYFQAKQTREGGNPTQGEIGPSLEFYLKPWLKLKNTTIFDLNEASKRPLIFAIGYRYLPSPNFPQENRLRLDLTPHFPMRGKILITDRNRADLDWQSGKFMALSQQADCAETGYYSRLSSRTIHCRRVVLPESISEMEHNCFVRGLLLSCGETSSTRTIL